MRERRRHQGAISTRVGPSARGHLCEGVDLRVAIAIGGVGGYLRGGHLHRAIYKWNGHLYEEGIVGPLYKVHLYGPSTEGSSLQRASRQGHLCRGGGGEGYLYEGNHLYWGGGGPLSGPSVPACRMAIFTWRASLQGHLYFQGISMGHLFVSPLQGHLYGAFSQCNFSPVLYSS